jgi:acetyl-CoA carboxylase carboxyltransferase component
MFDLAITIKDVSKLYVNAPFIVGKEVGTADFAAATGISAYAADTAAAAYAYARELVTLLPQNNADACLVEPADDLNRTVAIDGADAETTVIALADNASFIRLYKDYTDNAILGFASFGGVVSGVVSVYGALDIKTARAAAKLVSFCDSFGMPVVTLVDSCGLDVDGKAEENAYASELAKLAYAYATAENAKVTAVVGKAYGAAFTLLGSKSVGADMVFALPGAAISVLSPEASVAFVWNDKVGEKSREELETEWKEKCASAADACDRGEVDDIVESTELRKRICASLMMLATKADGKPARRHANMPL